MNAISFLKASKSFTSVFNRRSLHCSAPRFARVLCTDGVDELCVKIFQSRGHEVDLKETLPEAELLKIIGEYDGLVVRSATKVNPAVLKAATKMRVVGRAGVGVDNINVAEATKAGVMVMNTPGGNTISTAQLAVSLLCSMARKVPAANMSVKTGKWDRKSFTGVELNGKTIGIVGCGRIGQVVASCAKTMGMSVIGFDPIASAEDLNEVGIEKVSMESIFKKSDFITLHTPLTPDTANLINDTTIGMCKHGVHIVNCARGGIVDEAALLRALKSGKVAGAALDVYSTEPPGENLKELLLHPNMVCTPHLGASTDEAQINVARDIAVQMCDVFDQKDYVGIVNVSYMSAATLPPMKPFMQLAETIGAMQGQLSDSKVRSVTLKTWGGRDVNITNKQSRQLLEAQVLKGLLRTQLPEVVPDLISAPGIAKAANIDSVISNEQPDNIGSPYWNLVQIEVVRADKSTSKITGSVFGSTPHIVQVDEFKDLFAFRPDGNYILTFRNQDKPGAISKVLEILSNARANVASVNVARLPGSPGQPSSALCFMGLDDNIPTNALNALRSLTSLSKVAKIQLK